MKYVLEYRTKRQGWVTAQEFEDFDKAEETRLYATRYEAKGTKDWRVRTVAGLKIAGSTGDNGSGDWKGGPIG